MSKIDEGLEILRELGLPRAQQYEGSSLTLLALADIQESIPWSNAKQRSIRIHDILGFIQEHYNKQYAENSRETIRRQTLHQFEQAGMVIRNLDDPQRATNSPNTVYAIESSTLEAIRKYGTLEWGPALKEWITEKGKLIERYEKRKKKHLISVELPDGAVIDLSPGKHNILQAKIIGEFLPRFCPKASVVYVGDTASKLLSVDKGLLKDLKITITEHDKLPDVVLYDETKKLLLLIEAVTAHGPLSAKRQIELEKTLLECKVNKVYVSSFPDFREFKKHIGNIAWDTEVWIADNPDHMIHFNGPKFFTVYGQDKQS